MWFEYSIKKLSETLGMYFELYGLFSFSVVEFVEPFDNENSDIMNIQVGIMGILIFLFGKVVIV